MRRLLVAGNWKMNGTLAAAGSLARALAQGVRGEVQSLGLADELADELAEMAVCPPFAHLACVANALESSSVALGAQDVCEHAAGAFTGETAGEMLLEFGCRYVLVGHSERRAMFGDTDARVAAKFERAQSCGITPVVCVGETLEEREAGKTQAVVERQLAAVLARSGAGALGRAAVAYEPVWAIGTGKTASPEQAQEVHAAIRAQVAREHAGVAAGLRILYGGSVKASNAAVLFAMTDIDGGLVGGAAHDAEGFIEIWRAANASRGG